MAPEMAVGDRDIDGRADLYALGCVAYKLLTGRQVFEEQNLVLACLGKDPADRPRSAEALAARLGQIEFAHPWTRERAGRWWRTHM
jgi:serine/threonine-protein kinase